MCLPALGLLWAFLGVAVRQGARSGGVASVPRAPRAQRSPVLRVGAAGATGVGLCAFEALPLECSPLGCAGRREGVMLHALFKRPLCSHVQTVTV